MRCIAMGSACLLFLGYAARAQAAGSDCHPRLYTSIEVIQSDTSDILIPVNLNGHDVYLVLAIDTGFSILDRRAVAAYGLREELLSTVYRTMKLDDERVKAATSVRNARINTLRYPRLDFLLADGLELPSSPVFSRPVVGLLGMDPFGIADLELDLAHRRINIFAPNRCAGGVMTGEGPPRWTALSSTWIHNYFFAAKVDGQWVETTLATSSATSQMHLVAAETLFGESADGTYLAKSLSIAGVSLKDVPLELTPRQVDQCGFAKTKPGGVAGYTGCAGPVPLRLGMDVLQRLHIYLAAKVRKIYIEPVNPSAATPAQQIPDDRR